MGASQEFRFHRWIDPLRTKYGEELAADVYEAKRGDGRPGLLRHVVFTEAHEERVAPQTDSKRTRLIYRAIDESKALFLGMYVHPRRRGQGLGKKLIGYYQDHIQAEGLRDSGTARIHKPGVALILVAAGYEPSSRRHEALVLPHEGNLDALPRVQLAHPEREAEFADADGFYRVMSEDYRPPQPGKIIALHTTYHLPQAAETPTVARAEAA